MAEISWCGILFSELEKFRPKVCNQLKHSYTYDYDGNWYCVPESLTSESQDSRKE